MSKNKKWALNSRIKTNQTLTNNVGSLYSTSYQYSLSCTVLLQSLFWPIVRAVNQQHVTNYEPSKKSQIMAMMAHFSIMQYHNDPKLTISFGNSVIYGHQSENYSIKNSISNFVAFLENINFTVFQCTRSSTFMTPLLITPLL